MTLTTTDAESHLLSACFYNNIGRVEQLILSKQVTDLNFENQFGCYPLWYAVVNNYFELAKTLIEHGVDLNWEGKNGKHILYGIKDNKMLGLLMSHELDVHYQEGMTYSPLYNYMKQGNIKMINTMVYAGVKYQHLALDDFDDSMIKQIKACFFAYEALVEKNHLNKKMSSPFEEIVKNKIKD